MRISSESSLTVTNVTNDAVQVQLHQGTLNVHVRKLYDGEAYEVDTQNLAFTITKSGEYRFDVDPNSDTTIVTVWKGEGEATGQGPSVRVRAGEQARFTGGTSLAHQVMDAPRRDGFDDWCKVRDQREDESTSAQYVAPAWLEPAIWMSTEPGTIRLNMETCGNPVESHRDGRRIAMGSGSGKRLGDGLG